MPSNVSFEYAQAEKKYHEATTPLEKLVALQEMKSTAPSHKGAEKMRAEISKKIAKLKAEIDRQKAAASKKGRGPSLNVPKEGIGQVALVGPPNTGKSWLLKKLTNAEVEVADYPFTTTKPVVGMLPFGGAHIQLVEIPAIIKGSSEGKANGVQLLSVIRNADAIVFTIASEKDKKMLVNECAKTKIIVNKPRPNIEIRRSGFKGITIANKKHLKIPQEQLVGFLKSLGYQHATVILNEPLTSLDTVAQLMDESIVYKKALFANALKFGDKEVGELPGKLFPLLGKILVYTKKPGEEADMDEPLVLRAGSTVDEVAKQVHKDFLKNMKFVRVWGSAKFPGQRVARNYPLQNGDVIEING